MNDPVQCQECGDYLEHPVGKCPYATPPGPAATPSGETVEGAESDAKDAARYRWLRDAHFNPPADFYYHTRDGRELVSGDTLDRAIDTAIAKENL